MNFLQKVFVLVLAGSFCAMQATVKEELATMGFSQNDAEFLSRDAQQDQRVRAVSLVQAGFDPQKDIRWLSASPSSFSDALDLKSKNINPALIRGMIEKKRQARVNELIEMGFNRSDANMIEVDERSGRESDQLKFFKILQSQGFSPQNIQKEIESLVENKAKPEELSRRIEELKSLGINSHSALVQAINQEKYRHNLLLQTEPRTILNPRANFVYRIGVSPTEAQVGVEQKLLHPKAGQDTVEIEPYEREQLVEIRKSKKQDPLAPISEAEIEQLAIARAIATDATKAKAAYSQMLNPLPAEGETSEDAKARGLAAVQARMEAVRTKPIEELDITDLPFLTGENAAAIDYRLAQRRRFGKPIDPTTQEVARVDSELAMRQGSRDAQEQDDFLSSFGVKVTGEPRVQSAVAPVPDVAQEAPKPLTVWRSPYATGTYNESGSSAIEARKAPAAMTRAPELPDLPVSNSRLAQRSAPAAMSKVASLDEGDAPHLSDIGMGGSFFPPARPSAAGVSSETVYPPFNNRVQPTRYPPFTPPALRQEVEIGGDVSQKPSEAGASESGGRATMNRSRKAKQAGDPEAPRARN